MRKSGLWIAVIVSLAGPALAAEDVRAINKFFQAAGEAEQNGDDEAAIRAYSGLLTLRPGDEAVLKDRGDSYYRKKDFSHALDDYSQAIRLKPGDAGAYDKRGLTRAHQNDMEGALEDFNTALKLNPEHSGALANRALFYDFKRDLPRAIADYSALIKLQPDNDQALNARCWDRAFLNRDLDGALADCNAALGLTRNRGALAAIRDSRGFVWFRKGDMARAIADYDAALALNPRMAETLYKRGLAKNRKGEDGKPDIAAALKRDPHAGDDMTEIGLKP